MGGFSCGVNVSRHDGYQGFGSPKKGFSSAKKYDNPMFITYKPDKQLPLILVHE